MAVEAIESFIRRSQRPADSRGRVESIRHLSFTGNRLKTAIYLANRRVLHVAEGHDGYTGMGTTVVCALMSGAGLSIGHVGDSRLYLLSNGLLSPQTRDDTWAATVLAGHEGDSMQPADHPCATC